MDDLTRLTCTEGPGIRANNRFVRHLRGICVRNLTLNTEVNDITACLQSAHMLRDSELSCTSLVSRDRRRKLGSEYRQRRMCTIDTFFSLHANVENARGASHDTQIDVSPIYVSEIIRESANPNFRIINTLLFHEQVLQQRSIILRIWNRSIVTNYRFINTLEIIVDFRGLKYIAPCLEAVYITFPENCVLYQFVDGVYISYDDLDTIKLYPGINSITPHHLTSSTFQKPPQNLISTSSYQQLLRLRLLLSAVRDAAQSRDMLISRINGLLEDQAHVVQVRHETCELCLKSRRLSGRIRSIKAKIRNMESELKLLHLSVQRRRNTLEMLNEQIVQGQREIHERYENGDKLIRMRRECEDIHELMKYQRSRLVSTLADIFPITLEPPSSPPSGPATISNRPVTPYSLGHVSIVSHSHENYSCPPYVVACERVATVLGNVAQILLQLESYLGVNLPYHVIVQGSNSYMIDTISFFPLPPSLSNSASTSSASSQSSVLKSASSAFSALYSPASTNLLFPRLPPLLVATFIMSIYTNSLYSPTLLHNLSSPALPIVTHFLTSRQVYPLFPSNSPKLPLIRFEYAFHLLNANLNYLIRSVTPSYQHLPSPPTPTAPTSTTSTTPFYTLATLKFLFAVYQSSC